MFANGSGPVPHTSGQEAQLFSKGTGPARLSCSRYALDVPGLATGTGTPNQGLSPYNQVVYTSIRYYPFQ
jgi:hypothetical protein